DLASDEYFLPLRRKSVDGKHKQRLVFLSEQLFLDVLVQLGASLNDFCKNSTLFGCPMHEIVSQIGRNSIQICLKRQRRVNVTSVFPDFQKQVLKHFFSQGFAFEQLV